MKKLEKIISGILVGFGIFSTNLLYSKEKADKYFSQKNYCEEFIKKSEKELKQNPKQLNIYWHIAECFYMLHNYDKAIDMINKAIEIDPKNPDNWQHKAFIAKWFGKNHEELSALEKMLELDTSPERKADALVSIADIYTREGKYQKAIDAYTRIIDETPQIILGLMSRAELYKKTGKNDKAEQDLINFITVSDDKADAYYELGSFYRETGKYKKALESFDKALEVGQPSGIYCEIGDVYKGMKNYNETIKYYNLCAEKANRAIFAHLKKYALHVEMKKYSEAEKDLENIVEISIKQRNKKVLIKAYNTLGSLYKYRLNQSDKAEEYYEKAKQLQNHNSNQ